MRSGRTPIVLGGDHSLAMGSIGGVARHAAEAGRELFVLWLDAHSDFNTPLTSPSGNMHGMAAAMLCREPGFEGVFGDEPHGFIEPGRLHLFGIRSIDSGERRLLQDRGVDVVDMRMLDEHGFAVSIRRIIDRVRARDGLLHVSLDVDFLDPTIAPGVGTAVPGGATYREAHLVMELLYECGLVAVARSRRAQSVPRRTGQKRAPARRSDREPVRSAGLSGRAPRRTKAAPAEFRHGPYVIERCEFLLSSQSLGGSRRERHSKLIVIGGALDRGGRRRRDSRGLSPKVWLDRMQR